LPLLLSPLLPPQLVGEMKQKSKFVGVVKQIQRKNKENKLLEVYHIQKLDYNQMNFNS